MPPIPRLLFTALSIAISAIVASAESASQAASDYSFGYLLNGHQRFAEEKLPDVLCLETSTYGFSLDKDKLRTPRFGLLTEKLDYQQALATRTGRMDTLRAAQLDIELELAGKTYRAESGNSRYGMWDSGRVAQYYTLLDLSFKDEAGNRLALYGDLSLVAWPGSLILTVDALAPQMPDGGLPGRVGTGWYLGTKPLDIPHSPELEPEHLTLELWIKPKDLAGNGWLVCKNENEWGTGNYGLMLQGAHPVAVMNNTGEDRKETKVSAKTSLKADAWHHLAMTYDGRTLRLYVNGQEAGSEEIGMARQPGDGVLRIGQRADGNLKIVQGLYDQVRLWNRVLNAEQLKAHWQAPDTLSRRDGLVLDQSFDAEPLAAQPDFQDATLRLSLKTDSHHWQAEDVLAGSWKPGDEKRIILTCNLEELYKAGREVSGSLTATYKGQRFPIAFDPQMNGFVSEVKDLERSFEGGYNKITDYDELDLVLDCAEASPQPVPLLLYFRNPANITGLLPILCKPDGTPTGIPLQLSKNWHNHTTGSYLRAYALIPVQQGRNHYRLRIAYGFYGSLPSASHAQLCLLGGKGGDSDMRWDQLALSSGGESICFNVDRSRTDMAITDIRVPLGRDTKEGNVWGWTEAGWGADWLGVFRAGHKLPLTGMKAAYMAHGPCLSDVRYTGAFGTDRAALLDAKLEFPRSDDYGRTFQKLTYTFQKTLSAKGSYFHRLHPSVRDKLVAYGNADGMLGEARVTDEMGETGVLIPPTELTGPAPWWVAFPERDKAKYGGWAKGWAGYVAIIIRDYSASLCGTPSTNPWLNVTLAGGVETRFVPPPQVTEYAPGDIVKLDIEWAHLAPTADNYGWTNQGYIKALTKNPRSWKIAHREAVGNDIDVEIDGGTLLQQLPVVIRADQAEVRFVIKGGVGYVPVRFENLKTADGYAIYELVDGAEIALDQSVHGNDFWQTDYDARTGTYKMSFNLPVDGKPASQWILKRQVAGNTIWSNRPATD